MQLSASSLPIDPAFAGPSPGSGSTASSPLAGSAPGEGSFGQFLKATTAAGPDAATSPPATGGTAEVFLFGPTSSRPARAGEGVDGASLEAAAAAWLAANLPVQSGIATVPTLSPAPAIAGESATLGTETVAGEGTAALADAAAAPTGWWGFRPARVSDDSLSAVAMTQASGQSAVPSAVSAPLTAATVTSARPALLSPPMASGADLDPGVTAALAKSAGAGSPGFAPMGFADEIDRLVAALPEGATLESVAVEGAGTGTPLLDSATQRGAAALLRDQSLTAGRILATAARPTGGDDAVASEQPEAALAVSAPGAQTRSVSEPISGGVSAAREPAAPEIAVAENSAGAGRFAGDSSGSGQDGAKKKSLNIDNEYVTTSQSVLGTNVANSETSMPATSHPSSMSSLTTAERFASEDVQPTLATLVRDTAAQPAQTEAARRAVDTAMTAADHSELGQPRAVNLQFQISGVDLAVHVSLRGQEIHTTFRTDSPELRQALAQEWQAVAGQADARPDRLVAPVFAPTSTLSARADTGSSEHHAQRDPSARQGDSSSSASSFLARSMNAPAALVATEAPRAIPALASTRLLHAFA